MQLLRMYHDENTPTRQGCGGPVLLVCLLIALLLSGCKTITKEESYVEKHHMESFMNKMDSLMHISQTVQQDSSWRETIIKELQSIKEKSDTSHTLVVDTAGNVVKETIIINNTKEVTNERDRQEIVGLRHSIEKLDSTVIVQSEYISHLDSLLQQKEKETTIQKELSWWEKLFSQAKGFAVGIVLCCIVVFILKIKKKILF